MSEAYSLDARSLSVMRRSNHGSTGTASVTVHGSSLGSAALTAMGRMGQTGCEGTEWESETSVRCLVGHGARGTRRVAMTAGDRSGSMSGAYSSDMTGASMTSRGNRAGTGSASVTVHGSGLGLVSLTAMGRMGQTGCEGTEWESETSVRCLVGRGIQGTRRVAMTAGEREGTGSALCSMDVGSLSASRESNRAGTGSASVTVHGAGLGLVSLTAMGRIGQTGMRGDGVGVGDVGAVPGGAWCSIHAAGGDNGLQARREQLVCSVVGLGGRQCISAAERGDGVGVGDGAWIRAGARVADCDGTDGADGMRGDGVGVGDVGAVPGGAWIPRDAAIDIDHRRARRQHVGGVLA
jgi:hypothetical protein